MAARLSTSWGLAARQQLPVPSGISQSGCVRHWQLIPGRTFSAHLLFSSEWLTGHPNRLCTGSISMKLFKRLSFAAVLISATALTPLNAQSTPDSEGNDANLIAADGQQLFGKNDPNVRRATAQVNSEIITGTDMDHRLALIVAANENKLPPEELARFRAQILTNLIDETLQIQEAAANKIEVTDAEVDQYFDRVAQQNFKRPANQVEKYLTSIGASVATLKRQIKGELSWSRLLSRNVRPSANVSDDEVNAIIERIKATKGTTEYRLGEIYLSATPEAMPAVTENAKKIIDQLRQGANFVAYARQFSEASTASVG
ncbi:SurA N-terminal domain-containing protein, partial [Sphingorhabdus sp.]|uniref:SurA N-terminal domain-containing protein n=1 Tax=Sphingorhabdus sp. TaxID=1902408 RepID=UPI00405454F3